MNSKQHASLKQLSKDPGVDTVSRHDGFTVDPKALKVRKGFNLRQDSPEVREHIQRIKRVLIAGDDIPPIDVVVEASTIYVIDGHCRREAALLAIKEGVPIKLQARHFRGDEKAQTLHMLGTGTGSLHLTPLQNGHGFLRLTKQLRMEPQDIADSLGISLATVENGLLLAESPLDVQEALEAGQVTATAAKQAVKKHGKEAGAVIAKQHKESGGKKVRTWNVPKGAALGFYGAAAQLRTYIDADADEAKALQEEEYVQIPVAIAREILEAYGGIKKHAKP